MRRVAFLVVASLALVAIAGTAGAQTPGSLDDELSSDAGTGQDAGEDRADAMSVEPGTYRGNLTGGIDETDVFAVDVDEDTALVLNGETTFGTVHLPGPFDPPIPSGETEAFLVSPNGDRTPIGTEIWSTERALEPAGTWLVAVDLAEPSPEEPFGREPRASYEFGFELFEIPDQDDAGSGRDAGGNLSTAVALPNGTSSGQAGPLDHEDVYAFHAEESRVVRITVESQGNLSGFATAGPADEDPGGRVFHPGEPAELIYRVPADGTQRVDVHFDDRSGAYEVTLERGSFDRGACHPQDDGGSGGDAAPWGLGMAALGEGELTGCLDEYDETDGYTTTLEPGDVVSIELESCDEKAREHDLHVRWMAPGGGVPPVDCSDADRSMRYVAEQGGRARLTVEADVPTGKLNYSLDVVRSHIDLPDPAVASIDDGAFFEQDTPVGEVPTGNIVWDTQPFEPRRQREVSVTVTNEGEGEAYYPVTVTLHAVPENCVVPGIQPDIHRSRCDPERILSGTLESLRTGQNVTFQAQWDTTRTVGDQLLVATLAPTDFGRNSNAADLDRANNGLVEETPVLVGTDQGMN